MKTCTNCHAPAVEGKDQCETCGPGVHGHVCAACGRPVAPLDRSACETCMPREQENHPADRWHAPAGCAPRKVLVHMPGLPHGKTLIEFHGVLDLVKSDDIYPTEEAAYAGAWLAAMETAGRIMAQATAFRERADKLRAEK